MVNRVIQQKIVKMRRRKRYATFSGGDTKIELGKISLSRQVINVGLRVPGKAGYQSSLNREVMREINPRSNDLAADIPRQLQITMDKDVALKARLMLKDQDLNLKRLIFNGRRVKVFIFFSLGMKNIFLFKYDNRLNTIERSCNFSSLEQAQDAYHHGKVPWMKYTVEFVSSV